MAGMRLGPLLPPIAAGAKESTAVVYHRIKERKPTMATAHARSGWNADELLAAVKQLPAKELNAFQRQFAAWQGNCADEAALLAQIRQNSNLPQVQQQRFNRLRRKGQAEASPAGRRPW
jgi:hypothetical protein